MAYYDPQCIERLRFIRHAKTRHRLSVNEILALLKKNNDEVPPWFELDGLIFDTAGDPTIDVQALCLATGLSSAQVDELTEARLLLPMEQGRFDSKDTAAAVILAQAMELGVSSDDCSYYPELGREIVDREMALRHRATCRLSPQQDADLTAFLVRLARVLRTYVIDRLFQLRVAAIADPKSAAGGQNV